MAPRRTPRGGDDQYLTPDDLNIPLAQELYDRQYGARVPRQTVAAMILPQLLGRTPEEHLPKADQRAAQELATLIADALPEEALFQNIVMSLDLRPYVQKVIDLPDKRFEGTNGAFMDRVPAFMQNLQSRLVEMVSANVPQGQLPGLIDTALKFDPGLVTVEPSMQGDIGGEGTPVAPTSAVPAAPSTTVPAAGTPTATTVPDAPPSGTVPLASTVDAFTAAANAGPAVDPQAPSFATRIQSPGWDPEAFRNLAKAGLLPLESAAELEEPVFDPNTGELVQEFGPLGLQVSGAPGGGPIDRMLPRVVTGGVTAVQAMHWLKDLDEDEVAEVQAKMERAGMLPSDYDKGNAWDAGTETAWRALLAESYQRDRPTDQVLAGHIRRRNAAIGSNVIAGAQRGPEARREMVASIPALEQRDLDTAADDYALKVIGRPLGLSEKAELFAFMRAKREKTEEGLLSGRIQPRDVETTESGAIADEVDAFNRRLEQHVQPEVSTRNWDTTRNTIFKRAGVSIPDDVTPPVASTARPRVRYPGED